MALVRLCSLDDLEADGCARIAGPVGAIAVWKVGDQVFATADRCTHGAASLADDGFLEGFTIVCGLHEGAFDIRTGAVLEPPCTEPIASYPVELRDGAVFADLGEP